MDIETAFVHQFCNKVAKMADGYREMRAYYIFWDKRPGTPTERFAKDADDHAEYVKMFTV